MNKAFMTNTLILAGLYNILWGAWVVLFPKSFFNLINLAIPTYIELWQCIGMIVGVYGIGYLIASTNPIKHWPVTFVGLLGKIFGPIGFIQALHAEKLPIEFAYTIITNDLIWWIPFFLILKNSYLYSIEKVAI